ncbi:MAG: hypothetical protein KAQ92_07805, partial [Candidatus Aenigmarchaeota archaeon]|nr:hypothetical protein [Candidatus Aenigmarchaeota archaeon]
FGFGWREFGTAGIRNPAVQSSFKVIQELELDEFSKGPFSKILTGPNLINAVTILQQEAAITLVIREMQKKINNGNTKGLEEEFVKNIQNNKITIAYDCRLNGEYFAHILAAAFLRNKIKVNLFDRPGGMPALVYATSRSNSSYGFLISASHSEANYNGFKASLGNFMSQLDAEGKKIVMDARDNIDYENISLDLAKKDFDISEILKKEKENLLWLGTNKLRNNFNYLGTKTKDFYELYYRHVGKRTPLKYLPDEKRATVNEKKKEIDFLYTAFFGVGATIAGDLPGFFAEKGYCINNNKNLVVRQTQVMDGRFPGFIMPDPGVVEGWCVNFIDYLIQIGKKDLSNIDEAISCLNKKEVCIGTDPDIDRAGMAIPIPKGKNGNIKKLLLIELKKYIQKTEKISEKDGEKVFESMKKMNDFLLFTANDAWTFMIYHKLKIREENNALDKNKTYIIIKTHVTTPALQRVAQLYQKKGYAVFVVNTYVGFTELAKKSRDLMAISKILYNAKDKIENKESLKKTIFSLENANIEFKKNV